MSVIPERLSISPEEKKPGQRLSPLDLPLATHWENPVRHREG